MAWHCQAAHSFSLSNQINMSIFLALPSYDLKIDARANNAINYESGKIIRATDPRSWSWIPYVFNQSWCVCLNQRKELGVDYFMMLHADILPEYGFAEKMLTEMQRTGAHLLSAVSPFKNNSGLTSTALNIPDHPTRRLTMKEIAKLPETFSLEDCKIFDQNVAHLMTNTGLILVDLNWVDNLGAKRKHLYFAGRDWLVEDAAGKLHPMMFPEDWHFSKTAADLGAKVMATRKVKITHLGQIGYENQGEWGKETDN